MAAVAGALTGRQWSINAHIVSVALSFFTFLMFGLVIFNLIMIVEKYFYGKLTTTGYIIVFLSLINIGCFVLILFVHLCTHPKKVWSIIINTPSYLAYTGAYSQTMVIHAFCNVDDVSWGTKGSASTGVNKYQTSKVFFVSSW
jgi:cellulose synthase/poly-beta-1,6-N-acetylglucosamine synthase-like glycosyltransferase